MHPNKVYVSTDTSQRLNMLSQRLGIKPNLSCRLGFCLSLEEFGIPSESEFGGKSEREFNWSTLFGQSDLLFTALLRQKLFQDGLDPDSEFDKYLELHLNRGVFLLFKRVRHIEDLGALLDSTAQITIDTEDI